MSGHYDTGETHTPRLANAKVQYCTVLQGFDTLCEGDEAQAIARGKRVGVIRMERRDIRKELESFYSPVQRRVPQLQYLII